MESLYKTMAYKDEYEIARLYGDPAYWERLKSEFDDPKKIKLMLAPPILSQIDPATGRPKKRAFGPWVFPVLRTIARFKGLRGKPLDPFGRTAERKAERALVETVLADLAMACERVGTASYGILCEIARLPVDVKGYGPVKEANLKAALARREQLLAQLDTAQKDGATTFSRPAKGAADASVAAGMKETA